MCKHEALDHADVWWLWKEDCWATVIASLHTIKVTDTADGYVMYAGILGQWAPTVSRRRKNVSMAISTRDRHHGGSQGTCRTFPLPRLRKVSSDSPFIITIWNNFQEWLCNSACAVPCISWRLLLLTQQTTSAFLCSFDQASAKCLWHTCLHTGQPNPKLKVALY